MSETNTAISLSKLSLVDLAEPDLPELAGFVAAQSGLTVDETLSRLTWLLLENPAREEFGLLGCGVRSSQGMLVGCILYLRQMYVLRQTPLLMLGSTCFYVDKFHRGSGGALFLKFARAANQWPLFGNSANTIAAQLWKARGATPIPESDHELLGVSCWPGVVEEFAIRRGAGRSLARAAGSATALLGRFRKLSLPTVKESELVRLSSAGEAAELLRTTSQSYVTTLRGESYIGWRYFSGRDPTIALFGLRHRRSKNEIFVAVNERVRGHRKQIRSLNVLDVFPKPGPVALAAVVGTLHERYRDRTDMIVLRNLDAPCRNRLLEAGFRRRDFESPNGWVLDRSGSLPKQDCYFVPADGDWLI